MKAGPAVEPAGAPYQSGWLPDGQSYLPSPGGTALACRGVALAGLRSPVRMVDIGCGPGDAVEHLRSSLGLEAVGLDPAPVRDDRRVSKIRAVGEALPFAGRTLDGVLLQCTLSVVYDQERVLAECSRVLVDGGKLVLADLYARNPNAVDRLRRRSALGLSGILTREELVRRLAVHQLDVQIWEDHTHLLRDFLFRFVMERGSMDQLWECGTSSEAGCTSGALKEVRAGYCLLVARRIER